MTEIKCLTTEQQRLVSENHNLIYGLAKKKHINVKEHYDILAIGLCKAAIGFDETKGCFSTFAYKIMYNEYLSELQKSMSSKIIPRDKLFSYDVPIKSDCLDDKFERLLNLIQDNNVNVEQDAITQFTYEELLKKLNDIEKKIISMLMDGMNQRSVARELGFSRSYISKKVKTIREKWIKNCLAN